MSSTKRQNVAFLQIRTPQHPFVKREVLRGKPQGNNLYKLADIPIIPTEYHYGDIVRCKPRKDDYAVVLKLVKPSKHSTLRVCFHPDISEAEFDAIALDLEELGAYLYASFPFLGIDVLPGGVLGKVGEYLDQLEKEGKLKLGGECFSSVRVKCSGCGSTENILSV